MRTLSGIILGVLIFISCGSRKVEDGSWEVTVRGKVEIPQQGGIITIRELTPENNAKTDTLRLNASAVFERKMRLTQPGYYQLNFYGLQIINVILNKSDLEINVEGTNMQGKVEIKGSPEHDLINKVKSIVTATQTSPEIKNLESQYNEAGQKNDEAKMEGFRAQYMALIKKGLDQVAELLLQQPGGSLATLDLLMQGNLLDRDQYANVYDDASKKLKRDLPNFPMAKEFVSQIEKAKVVSIGSLAPEIALPNPKGDTIRLSSLRGKYVLVDFWAKWCGPCRRENPTVVAAYHKFKAKGFEVYGVSLDRNKSEWEQAIAEDGLVWTQVSDLQYYNSQAARLYNVNSIPFSLLLDPRGIIIAKSLRGHALEQKLEEVLGKK